MGVFDAAAACMTRAMDWPATYGMVDHLRDRVNELPDFEVCGDGLLVERHLHPTKKAQLMEMVDKADALLEELRQTCIEVLRGL